MTEEIVKKVAVLQVVRITILVTFLVVKSALGK